MAKVDLELVKFCAQRIPELSDNAVQQLISDIETEQEAIKAEQEKEQEPSIKKQFAVIVNDPYGKIAETGFEYQAWVVQIPEDDAPMQALERLHKGVYDFNQTPKGRRLPLKNIAEACEFGSAKIYKEHKLWVKTKEPVLAILTNGIIPRQESEVE